MTERSLYALRDRAFTLVAAAAAAMLVCAADAAWAQSPGRGPCASYIVPAIAPGQSVLIGAPLNNLEVLVRPDPGGPEDLRAAVEAIRCEGIDRDGGRGTQVLRVSGYRIF